MLRRILHITTLLQGGAGRIVADLACAQRREGHDVAVACAAVGAPGYEHYPAWMAQLAGAGVLLLPVSCTFRRSLQHLTGAAAALDGADIVRAGLDLIHAHAAVPALVARTLSRRVPIVATMHGWNAGKAPEHAATDVAVYNSLDTVVVPSSAAAAHLQDAGVRAERITIVPYGVEPQPARGLAREDERRLAAWRAEGRLVVVCVGSVGVRKRQADLLEALAQPGVRDRFACAVIGETSDLASWQDAVRARGLDSAVAFVGRRDDVTDWMRAADLAVFPSAREGLPVALLEAAALGCAVIVSDIDEHLAVIAPDVSGLVFGVGDVAALANRLRHADTLGDAGRAALGRAAHAVWVRAYQPARMRARYADLYSAAEGRSAAAAGERWL